MGIVNREGALYMATGIDNSGLKNDAAEAEKIIDDIGKAADDVSQKMQQAGEAIENTFQDGASSSKAFVEELNKTGKSVQSVIDEIEKSRKATSDMFHFNSDATGIDSIKDRLEIQKQIVAELEKQYTVSKEVFDTVNISTSDTSIIAEREKASKLFKEIRAELKAEKDGLVELEKEYNKLSKEEEKRAKQQEKASSKQISTLQQIKQLSEEMRSLRGTDGVVSPENLQRYDELKKKLAELGTSYRIVQQEQKALTTAGSATLSGVLSGMSAISGVFSAGQGVVSLFVKDNEKLAAIQTKLQAAMAITIGLQQVSTALHSTSSFRINVVTKATQLWTVANYNLGKSFVRMGMSANAAKIASAGVYGIGIGALIVSISLLVKKYQEWNRQQEETKRINKIVSDSIKQASLEGERSARKESLSLELLYKASQNINKSKKERLVAVKEIQKLYPSYFGNLSKEDILAGKGADAYNRLAASILAAAKARAAQDRIVENQSKILDLEAKKAEKETELNENSKTIRNQKGAISNDARIAQSQEFAVDRLQSRNEALNQEISNITTETGKLNEANEALAKSISATDLLFDPKQEVKDHKQAESAAEKARKQAEAIAAQNEKINQLKDKQTLERKRSDEDLENQATQARINAMQSSSEKIKAQQELDNKLEIQSLERQKEDYIRAYIQYQKEIFDAQEELESKKDPKYKKKIFDSSLFISKDAISNLDSQMNNLFSQKGNVDLLARPLIDASELVKKGWEDAGEGIATVFSSQFGILDKDGKEVEILVTPILPNGDVLSPNELEDYIDNVLQGNDILKADNLGIVIGVGVDPDGEAGDQLHKLQEELVDLKEKYTLIDTSFFDTIIGDVKTTQLNKGFDDISKSWNEYFIQFGNYQEKRKAIIEKYNREIAEAQTEGDKAILQKNMQNDLADLDNSIQNSASLMGQLFADASKKSVKEIQAIIDKAELLMKYLEAVKDEQGNAIIGGKAVSKDDILGLGLTKESLEKLQLSPEQIEAIGNALNNLKGDLGSKSPFKLFEKQIGEAVEKMKKGDIPGAIIDISAGINQFGPEVKEFGNSLSTLFGDDKMGENIALVVDGIEGIGTASAGVAKIMSGDVVGGVMDVVNGAAKAVNAFGSLFGPNGTAYYEKIRSQLEAINNIYESIIQKSKEKIVFGGGFASINAANTALENYYKKEANLQKIAQASGRSGASWKSHSAEWHSNKNVGKENFKEMSSLLGKSINSMYDLYYLSGEELYLIQSQMPEAWAQIDKRILENLNSIVDCKDEALELKDALNEALTGISQDSFYNDFINNLSDMSLSWEDMCDNFEDSLRKSIIAGLVADQYKDRINSLYQSWSDAARSDNQITEQEAARLRQEYQSIVEQMMKDRQNLADSFGWGTPETEASSKGLASTISQDSANELNGNFFALLQKASDTRNICEASRLLLFGINNGLIDINSVMRENSQVFRDSLKIQEKIEANTAKTAAILDKIQTLGLTIRN